MKIFYTIFLVFILLIFNSCRTDSRDNSRAYVEGKITGNQIEFAEITIVIESEEKVIAETIPDAAGQFIISGPLLSESFSIILNKKIKSFSASKTGCTLAPNALEIIVPKGITYLTFNEIILE